MAVARRVIPGAAYLVTRRTYQRTYRLRPHPVSNAIAEYCAAWAAEKCGIVIHAFVVMSNHHHLVVSDPRGVLPDFLRELHRTFAKALNASQGQWENLWAAEPASAVRLPTLGDIVDKIAYCAANPVAAALVNAPDKWPGVNLWLPGTHRAVRRPAVYFDPSGTMPELVELRCEPPAEMRDQRPEWRAQVRAAVQSAVTQARASVASQGLVFLGADAMRKKSFLHRARSYESRRQINPVLAARDVAVRKACLRVEKEFRIAYREALRAWTAGDRSAVFPVGTWWLRVHHRARARAAPV